jgi:hypothetical protein
MSLAAYKQGHIKGQASQAAAWGDYLWGAPPVNKCWTDI